MKLDTCWRSTAACRLRLALGPPKNRPEGYRPGFLRKAEGVVPVVFWKARVK